MAHHFKIKRNKAGEFVACIPPSGKRISDSISRLGLIGCDAG